MNGNPDNVIVENIVELRALSFPRWTFRIWRRDRHTEIAETASPLTGCMCDWIVWRAGDSISMYVCTALGWKDGKWRECGSNWVYTQSPHNIGRYWPTRQHRRIGTQHHVMKSAIPLDIFSAKHCLLVRLQAEYLTSAMTHIQLGLVMQKASNPPGPAWVLWNVWSTPYLRFYCARNVEFHIRESGRHFTIFCFHTI